MTTSYTAREIKNQIAIIEAAQKSERGIKASTKAALERLYTMAAVLRGETHQGFDLIKTGSNGRRVVCYR